MNTSAVEKYSIWARVALREGVKQRAMRYQLLGDNVPAGDELIQVDGRAITQCEMAQRTELLARIARMGEDAFLEQMAGTWFNRFFAMRYMEVHDYLPSRTRIFSDAQGAFHPQCIGEAATLDLPGLDQERVVACKLSGDDEALFHDIVLAQCAQLHEALPTVFDALDGADALMLPDHLLKSDGVCARLVTDLPDAEWESVEILGWAYQFFNAERKDEFFTSKRKAAAADIAPATQLFTPEWIVRYMAENSLGRLWMLNNPGSELAAKMEYFIAPDAEHEDFIRVASPEDITVCDPACGSGHILSYAFELLFQMYEERGYRERDIPELILTKNLSGIEIDPRAAQIATLVLALRAREHDRRFFSRGVTANIVVLESIEFSEDELAAVPSFAAKKELVDTLAHLGECGSLFAPNEVDLQVIRGALDTLPEGDLFTRGVREKLVRALAACEALSKKYSACIANPPYMGSSKFNPWMSKWVKKHYVDVKSDLFSAFIVRIMDIVASHGEVGLMTPFVWMFIGSYENLRNELIDHRTLTSLVQLEYSGFSGATVLICTFTFHNSRVDGYRGGYVRLSDFVGAAVQGPKALEAIQNPDCGWFYRADATTFHDIPGSPIAYWASPAMHEAFSFGQLGHTVPVKKGLDTGNNDKFLRFWHEISFARFGAGFASSLDFDSAGKKWAPHDKGGEFRKWYGNNDWVINWDNDGEALKKSSANLRSEKYYFSRAVTWSSLTSGAPSFRLSNQGAISNTAGSSLFPTDNHCCYLAYMNSSTAAAFFALLAPTLNFSAGPVGQIPSLRLGAHLTEWVDTCVQIARSDWDSQETSWDFKRNPLV